MSEKENNGILFAALKLLEALHHDEHIPAYMFQNILTEYAEQVDTTKFILKFDTKEGE